MVLRWLRVFPHFRVSNLVFVIFVFVEDVEDACSLHAASLLFFVFFHHFYGAAFFVFLDMVVHPSGHMDCGPDVYWAMVHLTFSHMWPF